MGKLWGICPSGSPVLYLRGEVVEGVDVQLVTIAEASEQSGLSEKAIRRRIEQGTLASIRRGSRRMIPQAEVDRLRDELDFPRNPGSVGNGEAGGGEAGNPTNALIVQLGKAVETVQAEVERRVNAERDRDAAVERERSERQAREAAEAEIVALRARVTQLQAGGGESGAEAGPVSDDASGLEPAAAAPRREWWRRMLGGA